MPFAAHKLTRGSGDCLSGIGQPAAIAILVRKSIKVTWLLRRDFPHQLTRGKRLANEWVIETLTSLKAQPSASENYSEDLLRQWSRLVN